VRKYASLEVLEAWRQAVPGNPGSGTRRIVKAAHRVTFDYEPRPGYLYLRSRMISSRTNDNHDTFPADEIEKGYKTFLGKPVFVNHNNENHHRARGVIVAVALHRDRNPDGTPDTWVEGLHEVDAVRFPRLAKAVLAGRVNRTSMGVDVDWSTCSACGNKATSPAEYCKHLPALKGKKIRQRNKTTGKLEEKLIHEVCAGLSFFENSLLVEDPADPTAYVIGKPDARGMAKAASARTASGEPDFRDHFGNTCRNCGDAVAWIPGNTRHPPRFKHDSGHLYDHDPDPVNPQDKSGRMAPSQFGGTHCLFCGDPVRINLHSLSRPGGGWYHEDGMKREGHDAYPADPQKVYDSVPGVRAQYDQARSQMKDHMHGLFEQLEGRPLPRSPRGDEHQMPPDPFTASKKTAGVTAKPSHCVNCGTEFGSMYTDKKSGSWPHQSMPFLCNDCFYGHMGGVEHSVKGMPVRPMDKGGTQYHPVASDEMDYPEHYETGKIRPWEAGDALKRSQNARSKKPRGRQPKPVRGYGRDPKFDGLALKKDKNGFYVHTHRSRSDSYPTVDDIPDQEIEQIRATGSIGQEGSHCSGCGAQFSGKANPEGKSRSRFIPFLCRDCAPKHAQTPDMNGMAGLPRTRPADVIEGDGRFRQYHPDDHLRQSQNGFQVQAYGETRVPPQVDTLRMDECPVCGEHNVWSGSRCPVCGFVVPPSVFRDPDTSKAGEVRDQLDSSGDVTLPPDAPGAQQPDAQLPVAQVGSGQDADGQLVHPDQIAPDGVPTVQGGDPGETDGQPPDAQEDPLADPSADPGADPEAGEEEQNLEGEGDVPPEDPAGELEDQPGDDLICPACGTTFETDAAAQPGVPCPACGMASLHLIGEEDPGGEAAPPEGAEDPSGDGEEEPEAEQDEEEDKDMPASKTAAVIAQAQARRIAELSAQNEVLHAQLSFLASAAGIAPELAEVGRRVMRRHADILNPAQPVPDPPEGPPSETTEQALMPESMDNAGRPGTTPGANAGVPAQMTTTPITPGVEMQTPPATNLVDVTAPVQGTNPSEDGGVPLQQRRIETDVRIDPDPLKAHGPGIGGQGDNGAAFPWILDARGEQGGQPGAQKAASLEADASRRTFASIRLAKMRVQAGLAQGDELAVAERIEKDASTPTDWIEREISILSQTPVVQQRQAARPVARTAARSVPSLASVGASSQYAPAAGDYDLDASDLFD
jgi:predicted  nucleic acid-binding Zn-ribbon protein